MCPFKYCLFDPYSLTPTEEVEEARVADIKAEVLSRGRWTNPITAHEDACFVMDGHHRLAVARRLRLVVLPVVFLGYRDVNVSAWRDGEVVTPKDILAMAQSRRLFPCKTTKHTFKIPLPLCDIPLTQLGYCTDPIRTTPAVRGYRTTPAEELLQAERPGQRNAFL